MQQLFLVFTSKEDKDCTAGHPSLPKPAHCHGYPCRNLNSPASVTLELEGSRSERLEAAKLRNIR